MVRKSIIFSVCRKAMREKILGGEGNNNFIEIKLSCSRKFGGGLKIFVNMKILEFLEIL